MNAVAPAPLELRTRRLILRAIRDSDEELYCTLFCDPDMMRFIGPTWTRAEALRAFHGALEAMRAESPRGVFLAVLHQYSPRPHGLCTLQNFDALGRRAELGMMIAPTGRAHGAAAEALVAVLKHAFATLPFDEIWSRFAVDHVAARKTAVSGGLIRHAQDAPEDLAARLCRWSAHRSSWRPPAREAVLCAGPLRTNELSA